MKDSNSLYAATVTLAFKWDEGQKNQICIDHRKFNSLMTGLYRRL